MENHTLILSTSKLPIPESLKIDFVIDLINQGITHAEYFGPEIDNQEDYIDDSMIGVRDSTTYIEFYFGTDVPLEYEMLTETDVDSLILNIIQKSGNIDLRADGKDITIYL